MLSSGPVPSPLLCGSWAFMKSIPILGFHPWERQSPCWPPASRLVKSATSLEKLLNTWALDANM